MTQGTPPGSAFGQPANLGYGGPPHLKPKGFAITSLVLGICGVTFCIIPYLGACIGFVCSILAIIFGVIGRKAAKRGEADGEGMATAGLILGCIGVGLIVLLIVIIGGLTGAAAVFGS
jgi:hypothetical protein